MYKTHLLAMLMILVASCLNHPAVEHSKHFIVMVMLISSLAKLELKVKNDLPKRREQVLQALKDLDQAMKQ